MSLAASGRERLWRRLCAVRIDKRVVLSRERTIQRAEASEGGGEVGLYRSIAGFGIESMLTEVTESEEIDDVGVSVRYAMTGICAFLVRTAPSSGMRAHP